MNFYFKKIDRAIFLLILMLFFDIIFIFLHIFCKLEFISNSRFLITKDHGYAENFQYIKEVIIIVLFSIATIKKRKLGYFSWMLTFSYIFMDDFFRIHERGGSFIKHHFILNKIQGIGAQNMGELIVTSIVGIVLISLLGISYYFSDKDIKRFFKIVFFFLLVLVFFGVIVDIGGALVKGRVYRGLFAIIEDGGEMVVMSFILYYIFETKIYRKIKCV